MKTAEKIARQLMDKLGIKDEHGNLFVGISNYASVSNYHNDAYISVAFIGDRVLIDRLNEYDLKDVVLSFGWVGELTYYQVDVSEYNINM